MKQFFNTILPLADHLYIFQNFEYKSSDFLQWFFHHPLKRNLQRKHSLDLTSKALLLLILSLIFIISLSVLSMTVVSFQLILTGNIFDKISVLLLCLLFVIFYTTFSPIFLILSQLILTPLDNYQKQKILTAARTKLDSLPNLKIVAIVGSFGKTSTKNMLYTLLWKKYRVVKTPKSFNTPISIARSVLEDLKDNTEVFLVEMDAYHPGEITSLCNFIKPSIGVITSVAAQHLGRFGSMEKLAKTQFEIANHLAQTGTLFINTTDLWSMKLMTQDATYQIKNNDGEILEFGFENDDDFYAKDIKQTEHGLSFNMDINYQIKKQEQMNSPMNCKINLPLFGTHHVINFLTAASIAYKLGMTLPEIATRSSKILSTPHRLEIIKQGEITIIDNSYNTNPTASKSSLKLLKDYPGSQKILITPGLVELGNESAKENQEFAKAAAQVADLIIVVGNNAKNDLKRGLAEVNYPQEQQIIAKDFKTAMEISKTVTKPNAVILLENDLPDQYF